MREIHSLFLLFQKKYKIFFKVKNLHKFVMKIYVDPSLSQGTYSNTR
jgi:hypothetical protein